MFDWFKNKKNDENKIDELKEELKDLNEENQKVIGKDSTTDKDIEKIDELNQEIRRTEQKIENEKQRQALETKVEVEKRIQNPEKIEEEKEELKEAVVIEKSLNPDYDEELSVEDEVETQRELQQRRVEEEIALNEQKVEEHKNIEEKEEALEEILVQNEKQEQIDQDKRNLEYKLEMDRLRNQYIQKEKERIQEERRRKIEAGEIEEAVEKPEESLIDRLKSGLNKTRDAFNSAIDNLVNGKAQIDEELYEELEEILISADMGVDTTVKTIDELRDVIEKKHIRDPKEIKGELNTLLKQNLSSKNQNNNLNIEDGKQSIILVIGVNGVGKTTTIGKLAYNLQNEGKSVMMAAADTFRAAAIDQLQEWADRVDVELIKNSEGSDPASVVYDAIQAQKANNKNILIIDTAGRLHNKKNLMNELEKINRIIDREHPDALKETLLILDATTGQNAVMQAKEFNKVTHISGLILTKLDGTAKGGVVFPLQLEHNIPVKYIGIGEQKDNLEKFDADKFVEALF